MDRSASGRSSALIIGHDNNCVPTCQCLVGATGDATISFCEGKWRTGQRNRVDQIHAPVGAGVLFKHCAELFVGRHIVTSLKDVLQLPQLMY